MVGEGCRVGMGLSPADLAAANPIFKNTVFNNNMK